MKLKLCIVARWLREQREWMQERGTSRAGYVAHYGDYGSGGSAIYDADKAELDRLEILTARARLCAAIRQEISQ